MSEVWNSVLDKETAEEKGMKSSKVCEIKVNQKFFVKTFFFSYILLSMANEHSGSSNGNTLILPWQDKIKCRLQQKVWKKKKIKLARLCFYFSILRKDISNIIFTIPFARLSNSWALYGLNLISRSFPDWGPIIFHWCIAKCQL